MKNKYTIAYIGAVIAIPVALLFIVPAVSTTSASVWDFGGDMFADAQNSFTQAQEEALASFGSDPLTTLPAPQESTFTATQNTVTGLGASASASSGSTGASGATNNSQGGSAWATNSGYANANASVTVDCVDCDIECEVPAPTCALNVLPSTIHEGETVKLVWDTSDARTVSIDGIGSVTLDGSKDLMPTASRNYTLTATGDGGVAKCVKSVQVIPKVVPPAPTCTFDIAPASVKEGSPTTFTWDTTNATAVSIQSIGTVSVDGTKVVYPTQSRSYELTATGNGGTVKCTDTIVVTPKDVVYPAPTCTFDIAPASVKEGSPTTFTWDTTNATAVSIQSIGTVSVDGTKVVYPTQSRSYELTATGNGGTVKCTDTVSVTHDETPTAPRCDFFTASKSRINKGDSVTLSWGTTHAGDVSINNGVGSVLVDGSSVVNLFHDTVFTLTARSGSQSHTCQVAIDVEESVIHTSTTTNSVTNVNNFNNYVYNTYSSHSSSRNNDDDVRCDSFTVSDAKVKKGDEVTLRWKTSDADDVDINQGVGDVDDDGSEEVTIKRDTTFILTARGSGDSDTCRVTVRIDENDDDDDDNDAPRCVFSISDTSIRTGESVKLSWKNERTDRLVLKDGSKTLADSKKDSKIDEDVDTFTVSPSKSTTYTLDVYNGNKKESCTLDVNVGKGMVSGISLSQTPYTGFDAGPMLTAIFYGAIVLWGLVLAYVLVLKKKHSRILGK